MSARAIDLDPAIRLALTVVLRHVEPGWENCKTLVQAWLNGDVQQLTTVEKAVTKEAVDDLSTILERKP